MKKIIFLFILMLLVLISCYIYKIGYIQGINDAYINTQEGCGLLLKLEAEGYCRLRHGPMDYYGYLEHIRWLKDINENKTDFYAKQPDCKFPGEIGDA